MQLKQAGAWLQPTHHIAQFKRTKPCNKPAVMLGFHKIRGLAAVTWCLYRRTARSEQTKTPNSGAEFFSSSQDHPGERRPASHSLVSTWLSGCSHTHSLVLGSFLPGAARSHEKSCRHHGRSQTKYHGMYKHVTWPWAFYKGGFLFTVVTLLSSVLWPQHWIQLGQVSRSLHCKTRSRGSLFIPFTLHFFVPLRFCTIHL